VLCQKLSSLLQKFLTSEECCDVCCAHQRTNSRQLMHKEVVNFFFCDAIVVLFLLSSSRGSEVKVMFSHTSVDYTVLPVLVIGSVMYDIQCFDAVGWVG